MSMSERLQTIVRMVPEGAVICDIGTDHGLVPIELVKTGRSERAAACDILEGPLAAATENIRKNGLSDRISTHLSDGFAKLPEGLADTAVIAGMGGLTIMHIMEGRGTLGPGLTRFVLAPQSDFLELRKYLRDNDICIKDESMVLEDGKFYPVIFAENAADCGYERLFAGAVRAETGGLDEETVRAIDRFGPCLIKNNDPVLDLYLERRVHVMEEIENGLKKAGDSARAAAKQAEIEDERRLIAIVRRLKA